MSNFSLNLYLGINCIRTFEGDDFEPAFKNLIDHGPLALLPDIHPAQVRGKRISAVTTRHTGSTTDPINTITSVNLYELTTTEVVQVDKMVTFHPNWTFYPDKCMFNYLTRYAAYEVVPIVLADIRMALDGVIDSYLMIPFMSGTRKMEYLYGRYELSDTVLLTETTTYTTNIKAGFKYEDTTRYYMKVLHTFYHKEVVECILERGGCAEDAFVERPEVQSEDSEGTEQL